jgi:hypothetical protein
MTYTTSQLKYFIEINNSVEMIRHSYFFNHQMKLRLIKNETMLSRNVFE